MYLIAIKIAITIIAILQAAVSYAQDNSGTNPTAAQNKDSSSSASQAIKSNRNLFASIYGGKVYSDSRIIPAHKEGYNDTSSIFTGTAIGLGYLFNNNLSIEAQYQYLATLTGTAEVGGRSPFSKSELRDYVVKNEDNRVKVEISCLCVVLKWNKI